MAPRSAVLARTVGPADGGGRRLEREAAAVVRVVDGDTFIARFGERLERVRIAGFDAPERNQVGGSAAARALAGLLARGEVAVRGRAHDVYGRLVADVSARGLDVAGAMRAGGFHAPGAAAALTPGPSPRGGRGVAFSREVAALTPGPSPRGGRGVAFSREVAALTPGPSSGGRRDDRLQSAVIGGDLASVQDILQAGRRAAGSAPAAGGDYGGLLEALRNPDPRRLAEVLVRALQQRDEQFIELVGRIIAGRR